MRSVVTRILRFFVDDATPGRLCGSLQAVDGMEKFTFHDAESLLAILQRVAQVQPGMLPPTTGENAPDNRSAPK